MDHRSSYVLQPIRNVLLPMNFQQTSMPQQYVVHRHFSSSQTQYFPPSYGFPPSAAQNISISYGYPVPALSADFHTGAVLAKKISWRKSFLKRCIQVYDCGRQRRRVYKNFFDVRRHSVLEITKEPSTVGNVSRTIDSNSSRVNIFDVFTNVNEEEGEDFRKNELNDFEPMSPRKNAELHEWLVTSYYGTIHKNHLENTTIPINYPVINNVLCGREAAENYDSKSDPTSVEDETNSLFNPISQTDKNSTTVIEDNEYAICRDCKSRYTRNRTTRYVRITWIILSCFLLSISLFPWGLLSAIFVVFVPYQIRRPMCKKCRNSAWGF